MALPGPKLRKPPPEPYVPQDPTLTGAWPGDTAPKAAPVMVEGRDNVTAAGDHIGSAPDLDLGPSGNRVVAPEDPPQETGRPHPARRSS
jgi:hypothetical protein